MWFIHLVSKVGFSGLRIFGAFQGKSPVNHTSGFIGLVTRSIFAQVLKPPSYIQDNICKLIYQHAACLAKPIFLWQEGRKGTPNTAPVTRPWRKETGHVFIQSSGIVSSSGRPRLRKSVSFSPTTVSRRWENYSVSWISFCGMWCYFGDLLVLPWESQDQHNV